MFHKNARPKYLFQTSLAIALLLLMVGIFGYVGMRHVGTEAQEIRDIALDRLEHLDALNESLDMLFFWQNTYLGNQNKKEHHRALRKIEYADVRIYRTFEKLNNVTNTKEEMWNNSDLLVLIEEIRTLNAEILQLSKYNKARALSLSQMDFRSLKEMAKFKVHALQNVTRKKIGEVNQEQYRDLILYILTAVLALFIVVVMLAGSLLRRERAEESLKVSEEKFRAIFDQAGGYFMILDPNTKDGIPIIVDANKAALSAHGYTREEFIGKPVAMIDDEESKKLVIERTTLIMTGKPFFVENAHVRKDGTIFHVAVNAQRIDIGDNPPLIFSTEYDITEQKQAEESLRESEARFRSIFNQAAVGVARLAPDGTWLAVNKKLCDIVGYSQEELLSKTFQDITHPDDLETDLEYVHQLLEDEIQTYSIEKRYVKKDGDLVWINLTVSLVRDTNNNPDYFISIIEDITERKQVEEALKVSEGNLKNTFNLSPSIISKANLNTGYFIEANQAATRILGYSIEEFTSTPIIEMIHPDDIQKTTDIIEEQLKGKEVTFFENRYLCKDGSYKWMAWHGTKVNKHGMVTAISSDITERKLAEISLKENEMRLRLSMNAAKAGSWIWEIETNEVIWDDRMQEIFGFEPGTYDGTYESWKNMVHPDDVEMADRQTREALENGADYNFQYRLMIKSETGSCRTVRAQAIVISNQKGERIRMVGFCEDITEQKQAEDRLKISEQRSKAYLENSPACTKIVDLDLNLQFMSQSGTKGLHIDNIEEYYGKPYPLSFYPDSFKVPMTRNLKQAKKTGEIITQEAPVVDLEGNELWFHSTIVPVKDDGGLLEYLMVVSIDTTERKQAEEALHESEAKLKALFTSLTEMVVMHELVLNAAGKAIDYRIIDCNKVFTDVTGIRKEDAIGKLASEVYQTDPPPYLKEYSKVGLSGESHEFNTFFPSLDKHFMISVVSPQAGKFATITTDISAMMQLQETLIEKNKEMEDYLYVASHDLRTPLVNIQGFSQRLKKQADSIKTLFADKTLEPETLHQLAIITDEDIPKTLSFVVSNIEKMDTLINGLLQLSRTARVEMNIRKIDMNALFAKILHSLDFQIQEAQCKIHINPLPKCYGDATLLDQLFVNIISNALKYSDSKRALEMTVDAKKTYNKVVYTIRDTGKGIAQKHLDKIWNVFYRIDPRSGKTGEGIGLSLVKRIVEKHKGKVWAESEENKGSVFHIELHNRSFTEL